MVQRLTFALLFLTATSRCLRADVLIVADEIPAMQWVADRLKNEEHIKASVIWQTNLPPSLAPFEAVVVYIHKELSPKAEDAFIKYTKAGGKLVALHHSISSGKRKNKDWFSFLGVSLPERDLSEGGYKWIEPADWSLVNINPRHFIMTNKVVYAQRIDYQTEPSPPRGSSLPGFTLENSEVYLNHVHTAPRTVLMGLKYTGINGVTYMQDRAGWLSPAGKGWIVYLMPGHRLSDFENPAYGRIVLNAVVWKP